MISKSITFNDVFTGEEITRTFYFHINKAEALRIVGRDRDGDWEKYVKIIVESGDIDRILDFMELIIRNSIGTRTPDGLFVKNRDIADSFIASEAYGELFQDIINNPEEGQNFFAGMTANKTKQPGLQAVVNGNRHHHKNKHKNKK